MFRTSKRLYCLLLLMILSLGLYLRLANLSQVQLFEADQGFIYLEMAKWLKEGQWPLIGMLRHVGDHNIGPGFHYILAPLMQATDFHPSSGAATIAIFKVLAILLSFFWLKRASGNEPAAMALAFCLAVSPGWVTIDRYLHNAELLPFIVVAIAFLLDRMRDRPLPSLALLCIILAYIPQTHTTGNLLIPPTLVTALFVIWQVREKLRVTSFKERWFWLGVFVIVLAALYVPPILYELKPGPGNLALYLHNMRAESVRSAGPALRWASFFDFPVERFLGSLVWYRIAFPLTKILFILSIFYASGWWLFKEKKPSLLFMPLLLAQFLLVPLLYGHPSGFFLTALVPLPPLLISFAIATFPAWSPQYRRILNLTGITVMIAVAIISLRISVRVPRGVTFYGDSFGRMQRVASHILNETETKPYSLVVAADGYAADYQYLLWFGGNRPKNLAYRDTRVTITELGENLYVLSKQQGRTRLNCDHRIGDYDQKNVQDVVLFRIPRSSLPADFNAVNVEQEGECINIEPMQ